MANRNKQDMTAELAEGKILPLVFKLTIPAVIAQLITFLYNIVDRMYVARIDGSGMDALAALGIVLPITLIMQAFANLVGLGGAPRAGIRTRRTGFSTRRSVCWFCWALQSVRRRSALRGRSCCCSAARKVR